MSTMTTDKTYRIARNDTQAMIIDVQDRLLPHIHEFDKISKKAAILTQGLQALQIPIMLNEQYPKGLGQTVADMVALLDERNKRVFEKDTFSACDNNEAWNYLAQQNRNNVILLGVETHVCVQQTALDLLDNGMQPIVIADAVGSRDPYDKKIALRRIRRAGAVVTTTEAILFELCRSSQDPAFKTISQLIK